MENVVKYRIFVKDGGQFVTESNLEALLAYYLAFLSPFIDDFIWQNEPFYLVTKSSTGLCVLFSKLRLSLYNGNLKASLSLSVV